MISSITSSAGSYFECCSINNILQEENVERNASSLTLMQVQEIEFPCAFSFDGLSAMDAAKRYFRHFKSIIESILGHLLLTAAVVRELRL